MITPTSLSGGFAGRTKTWLSPSTPLRTPRWLPVARACGRADRCSSLSHHVEVYPALEALDVGQAVHLPHHPLGLARSAQDS